MYGGHVRHACRVKRRFTQCLVYVDGGLVKRVMFRMTVTGEIDHG